MKSFVMAVCLSMSVMGLGQVVCAQEAPKAEIQPMEAEYGYGYVSSINDNKIVVQQYDEEQDSFVSKTYDVDKGVQDVLSGLKVGDTIEFNYTMKDGKGTVTSLEVYQDVEDETPDAASAE